MNTKGGGGADLVEHAVKLVARLRRAVSRGERGQGVTEERAFVQILLYYYAATSVHVWRVQLVFLYVGIKTRCVIA